MANLDLARRALLSLLAKPSTKMVEYSSMTKAEKIAYFRANYAHEIAMAKAGNVEHTFTKVRTFKHESTITENGAKVTKVNDLYVTDAMAFAAKYNHAMIDEIIGYYSNGGAPKDISVSYRAAITFDKFVACDADFIAFCEAKYGRPEDGQIEVETGYGKDLAEYLVTLGMDKEIVVGLAAIAMGVTAEMIDAE